MMHVMVSHAGAVQSNCAEAIRKYAPDAEFVDCSGSDQAYGEAIAARWGRGEDLVIIEHDNEITAEVLPSFAACPLLWCTYAYEIFAPPWTRICETGLGCARFSREIQETINWDRDVLRSICPEHGIVHPFKWGDLDAKFAVVASTRFSLRPHVHGRINHYHPYQDAPLDDPDSYEKYAVTFKGGFRRTR